jgi:signal transduction histidine kinase/ActR/RegA family two-component response regulator
MGRILANLRLRTKFLFSMVLLVAGLTWFSLLVVRHTAQDRARQELTSDLHSSLMMLNRLQKERQLAISRKADLLATSAFLSSNDPASFTDSTSNPLDTSRSDLMALANSTGAIVAFRVSQPSFLTDSAAALLRSSLRRNRNTDWWFNSGHLYEVVLQPVGPFSATPEAHSAGTVVVGQELDESSVRDLGRLLSSEIALSYQNQVVVSTLDPYRQSQLASQLVIHRSANEVLLGRDHYFVGSLTLSPEVSDGPSLMVLRSDSETIAFLDRLNRLLIRVGCVAVFAGIFLAFLISHTFTRPLGTLVQGVHALEHGNFAFPLKVEGTDEVAEVTLAFDRMRHSLQKSISEREQLEEQLRQSQKMEALGRLAGGVAHDFNNLLTIIKGHSDLLLDWIKNSETPYKSCEQIHKAADRASSLTRQLLIFSRRQVLQPKVLDLNALIQEMDKLLGRLIREDVDFLFVPGATLGAVKADPGQIEQVLLNLTVNACDAMPNGGKLIIETRNITVDESYAQTRPGLQQGSYVLLTTTDTGHGMDATTKTRIFEPFFTTKDVGKGTGLGLSTVYGIVKQSCGFIWVDSTPGEGARFEVYLPEINETADLTVARKTARPTVQGSPTVLVVEDDAAVRDLAVNFLNSSGYRVLAAKDGVEALRLAKQSVYPVSAVLTDIVMPNMRGTELAVWLRELLPELKVIFMSGYMEHNTESRERMTDGQFLEKPFSRDTLLAKVAESLTTPRIETTGVRTMVPHNILKV